MLRRFAPAVLLLPLLSSSGCIDSKSFAGTNMQLTLTGPTPDPAGQHYEIWARNQYNDILRISGIYDFFPSPTDTDSTRLFTYGFTVRPAIPMDDPCMIDGNGNLLVTAAAYQDTTIAGVFQTAEDQAETVRARIAQLTNASSCDGSGLDPTYHCGFEPASLNVVIPYEILDGSGNVMSVAPPRPLTCETNGNVAGCISFSAAAADRLAFCTGYWNSTPLAYTPNPHQITAPAHGQYYGTTSYLTTTPPSGFDSVVIDSNVELSGIQELFYSREPDAVDPNNRGPVVLDGTPDQGGIDVVHFDLTPPAGSAFSFSGTAALEVNLDRGSGGF